MKPGLPKKYAKMGFKKGWREFKKTPAYKASKGKPSKSKASKSKPKNKTGGRKRVGGFNTQKIFKLIRIGALLVPAASIASQPVSGTEKIEQGVRAYFGWSIRHGNFSWGRLAAGWMPYLASIGVTYGIPKIAGLIRGL